MCETGNIRQTPLIRLMGRLRRRLFGVLLSVRISVGSSLNRALSAGTRLCGEGVSVRAKRERE